MTDVLTRLRGALAAQYGLSREIGVGGMATVYLAHDIRHDRDVAIKVLHPELAAALGAERFLAEIKTTAKLQHPHILPLLDSGEAEGLLYYVMPYVAGESLRVRLERETQLPVDDAVRIAREVASALESAHKHGVVHRDIKPENILIHEDQALVADFGIALAVSAAGGSRMTQTGLSLGTPQYMAPEQAVGERTVDGRADIYALGAVLYEMLVGEAPFTGPSVQAIVARVMTEQPREVTGQRRSVPQHVNAAVLKALEKLPADRFSSAGAFSSALVTPGFGTTRMTAAEALPPRFDVRRALRRPSIAWSVAGISALAAIALLVRGADNQDLPVTHLAVDLAPEMSLDPQEHPVVELSPDGRALAVGVYARNVPHLVVRRMGIDSVRYVQGSAGVRGGAAFSPDGRWIAFSAEDRLLKAPVNGGPPTPLGHAVWGVTWTPNDVLVYTSNYDTGLRRTSPEGRDSTVLTSPDRKRGELGHWWPQALPDGDHVLFTNYTTPADKSRLEVLSLKTRERTVVLEGGYFGRYAAGWLLFVRGEVVLRVPFDVSRLKVDGSPVPTGLDIAINPTNGLAAFSLAPNGALAYLRGGSNLIELVRIDRRGNEESALDSAGRISAAVESPDGRRIALVRDGDVWVFERQRRLFTRLTRSEQRERRLVWSPDSKEVLYARDVPQFDIFTRVADASRPEELVLTSEADKHPLALSPDGSIFLYQSRSKLADGEDVFTASLNPRERKPPEVVLLGGLGNQTEAAFSPDGRSIAYVGNESGRAEVYVVPYPLRGNASRQQISVAGGDLPKWSKDGRAIYYSWAGRVFRVSVNPMTDVVGTPELLPRVERMRGWSLGADDRLLISRIPEGATSQSVNVVLNWASNLLRVRD